MQMEMEMVIYGILCYNFWIFIGGSTDGCITLITILILLHARDNGAFECGVFNVEIGG